MFYVLKEGVKLVKFEFDADGDASEAFQKDFLMHSKVIEKETRRYQWLLTVGGFLLFYFYVLETKNLSNILILLICSLVWFSCFPFLRKHVFFKLKRYFGKPININLDDKSLVIINDEGIERKSEQFNSKVEWIVFTHVRGESKYYFLYVDEANAIILPKEPFLQPEDKELYQEYVERYIKPLIK